MTGNSITKTIQSIMKKRIFSRLLILVFFYGYIPVVAQPSLQICHIAAGKGDASLFLISDIVTVASIGGTQKVQTKCAILIDGQYSGTQGTEVWRSIKAAIAANSNFAGRDTIDFIIASHLHTDHIGGLTQVMQGITKEKWITTGLITRSVLDIPQTCPKPATNTTTLTNFGHAVSGYNAAHPTTPVIQYAVIPPMNILSITNFPNFSMECVAANGVTIATPITSPTSYKYFIPLSNSKGCYENINENDLSFGFLLSFQGFHYLTMGDLGGSVCTNRYADGETAVTKYLKTKFSNDYYHLCALKINHHGSLCSTDMPFVTSNRPTLAVIPSDLTSYQGTVLPQQQVINNLSTGGALINYTFIPASTTIPDPYATGGNLRYYNDVTLTIINPSKNQSLQFSVTQQAKQKNGDGTFTPVAYWTNNPQTINCSKGHNW